VSAIQVLSLTSKTLIATETVLWIAAKSRYLAKYFMISLLLITALLKILKIKEVRNYNMTEIYVIPL